MNDLKVRIVTLPPMRFVCFNGFGSSPEGMAWSKLIEWAKKKGLLNPSRRFFGYNNPDPTPGSPNYGYDAWMDVEEGVQADEGGRVIEFPGGLYAVAHVEAGAQGENIYDTWQKLAGWVENSRYKMDVHSRQWLEEALSMHAPRADGSFALDLYEPIRE